MPEVQVGILGHGKEKGEVEMIVDMFEISLYLNSF